MHIMTVASHAIPRPWYNDVECILCICVDLNTVYEHQFKAKANLHKNHFFFLFHNYLFTENSDECFENLYRDECVTEYGGFNVDQQVELDGNDDQHHSGHPVTLEVSTSV